MIATDPPDSDTGKIPYETVALKRFHIVVTIAALSGAASDGFEINVIGLSMHSAGQYWALTPLWLGLLGGASLIGLFFGALVAGRVADKFGRRPIFAFNMVLICLFSGLQFFARSPADLLALRMTIGFLLGTDYVVSKALLVEFSPAGSRGRMVSLLGVAWAIGYISAYFAGMLLSGSGETAWRWILLTGIIPALLSAPLRYLIPESPVWLVSQGRRAQARQIISKYIGKNVALPEVAQSVKPVAFITLFEPGMRHRTIVGMVYFTASVVPYFAIGTFVVDIFESLGFKSGLWAGAAYNSFLLLGALTGNLIIDWIPRRAFAVGGLSATAGFLLVLSAWPQAPQPVTIALLAGVSCILSAASCLCYIYLTELFPARMRATGIGMCIAASRIGSAAGTFLLPIILAERGIMAVLLMNALVLLFGAAVCALFAPETRQIPLALVAERSL